MFYFNNWSSAKKEGKETIYGDVSYGGKNEKGQNVLNIGYSVGENQFDHPLGALFEETDHGAQYLEQRIGFFNYEGEVGYTTSPSYDLYDEADNKIFKVKAIISFEEGSKYKSNLYGLNAKILKWEFNRNKVVSYLENNSIYNGGHVEINMRKAVDVIIENKWRVNHAIYKK